MLWGKKVEQNKEPKSSEWWRAADIKQKAQGSSCWKSGV